MFNCPFCAFDYSEQGLREGRCPACGGVLAWQDEAPAVDQLPDDATSEDRAAKPDGWQATGGEARAAQTPESSPGAIAPDVQGGASQAPRKTSSEARPSTAGPAAHEGRPLASRPTAGDVWSTVQINNLSEEDKRRLSDLWGKVASGTARPEMTIRAESSPIGTASHLVIRPRTLRKSNEIADAPADYELLEVIGEGGVGVVYAARQASVDRTVAVKMLKSAEGAADQRDKFLSEAVVTGDLDHPNIVPIYDMGSNKQGDLFYSMKRVRGMRWLEVLEAKPLSENLEILMKVCDAIAFAHARGVVHRDIKPENVMIGGFGEVLVVDWGIAISTSLTQKAGETATTSGMGGTPAYMAPEMATGPLEKIGPASDVYLLGAVLYEIIAGYPPHTGASVMDCVTAAARNEIRTTPKSGELLEIALQAMATELVDRYTSVQGFQAAIRSYQSHSESIILCGRAEEDLAEARRSNDYQDFSRAVFAFEEALALWEGNDEARRGVSRARLAYAESAHSKEDFDLGLSLLDAQNREHADLLRRLRTAARERQARQKRLRSLRRLATALVVVMLLGATGASLVIVGFWRKAEWERKDAVKARDAAKSSEQIAKTARSTAELKEGEARLARDAAKKNAQEAIQQRQQAQIAKQDAELARQREEAGAYKAEIQVANERIHDNAINHALEILEAQQDSPKKKYRHWEWGRLRYLCGLAAATLKTEQPQLKRTGWPVDATALSQDGNQVAAGCANGAVYVWQKEPFESWDNLTSRPPRLLPHDEPVHALAFSPDGSALATAGGNLRRGVVLVWDLSTTKADPQASLTGHTGPVTSVVFSRDHRRLLTGSADQTARLWTLDGSESVKVLRGHFDTVWNAAFSAREDLVVTASQDGSARIWSVATATELQRFSGHEGAVFAAVFAPNDQQVASGGYDGRVMLWNVKAEELFRVAKEKGQSLEEAFRAAQRDLVRNRLKQKYVEEPPVHTFLGHAASVRTVQFSRDGRLMLSGSNDHTLKLWETGPRTENTATSPREVASSLLSRLRTRAVQIGDDESLLTLRGHGSWVSSSQLSSDGTTVVSGSFDTTAKIWKLDDYEELKVLRSERPVWSAALSPQGRYVAAAFDDGTARVWNASGPALTDIPPLKEGHDYMASCAAFYHGGRHLLTAAGDGTVRMWDVQRGTEFHAITGTGQRGLLALSPDEAFLLTGSEKGALIWDVETWGQVARLDHRLPDAGNRTGPADEDSRPPVAEITAASFGPHGRTVITGDSRGSCRLWDFPADSDGGAEPTMRPLPGHSEVVNAAAFLPGGQFVLTASGDYTVAQWDVRTAREEPGKRLRHNGAVTRLVVSREGDAALTASVVRSSNSGRQERSSNRVRVHRWEMQPVRQSHSLDVRLPDGTPVERVTSLAFDPGQRGALLTCSLGVRDYLLHWDFDNERIEPLWFGKSPQGSLSSAVYHPAGDRVLSVGGRGARLWDATTGAKIRSFRPHRGVTSIQFSPDEQFVVTSGTDGSAKIWTFADGRAHAVCKLEAAHQGAVNSVCFAPRTEQSLLLTSGDDRTAKLWSFDRAAERAAAIRTFGDQGTGHADRVRAAMFSPGGQRVLTVSDDGQAMVWNADDESQPPLRLGDHGVAVLCGTFSPDSRWIVTGAADSAAWAWDATSGALLARFEGHSSPVTSVSFSPDGQRLLSGSRDNSAKLWDATLIRQAQRRLAQRSDTASEATTNELPFVTRQDILMLEFHKREVTSVAFARDGQSVMTASHDGNVAIWRSVAMEPAVLLSPDVTDYASAGSWVAVDEDALLRDPSVASFDQNELRVEMVDLAGASDRQVEWLDVVGRAGLGVATDAGEISYEKQEGNRLSVATYQGATTATQPLVITFNENATGPAVEAVIRSVAYRNDALGDGEQTRTIRMTLNDAQQRTGNQFPEEKTLQILVGEQGVVSP